LGDDGTHSPGVELIMLGDDRLGKGRISPEDYMASCTVLDGESMSTENLDQRESRDPRQFHASATIKELVSGGTGNLSCSKAWI